MIAGMRATLVLTGRAEDVVCSELSPCLDALPAAALGRAPVLAAAHFRPARSGRIMYWHPRRLVRMLLAGQGDLLQAQSAHAVRRAEAVRHVVVTDS